MCCGAVWGDTPGMCEGERIRLDRFVCWHGKLSFAEIE